MTDNSGQPELLDVIDELHALSVRHETRYVRFALGSCAVAVVRSYSTSEGIASEQVAQGLPEAARNQLETLITNGGLHERPLNHQLTKVVNSVLRR